MKDQGEVLRREALHESEERFRLLVESVKDYAIFILDPEGVVVSWNAGAERIKGYTAEEIIGRHFSVFYTPEDRAASIPEKLLRLAAEDGRVEVEAWRVRKDGTRFFADIVITALRDATGQLLGYAKVTRDMTDRVRMEEELRAAKERAEEANQIKGQFLANMSHELRTPMNAVIGLADMLLESELTAEQRRSLELLRGSAESLMGILNEVLDLARIESGRLQLEQAPFSLSEAFGEALRTQAMRARDKGLTLICRTAPQLPEFVVGDAMRLRQIVLNLVSNAIKFTEQGEIRLVFSGQTRADGALELQCDVSDTGIGIPRQKIDSIFDSFVQADASTTRRFGGTGLGLAICARLVGAMGGRIWVESEPGKGSTFHFTVPVGVDGVKLTAPSRLKGTTVLLCNAHATERLVLQELLSAWGVQVTTVGDAAEATTMLEWARQGRPFDTVIMDVRCLPQGNAPLSTLPLKDAVKGRVVLVTVPGRHPEQVPPGLEVQVLDKPVLRMELLRAMTGAPLLEAAAQPTPCRASLRVLVVEDNPVNQMLTRALLERRGHDVVLAGTGTEGVHQMRSGPFDVAVVDIQMPDMDGFQVLEQTREAGIAVPMVAMTAHAMKGYRERCLAHGFAEYIPKPFKKEELYDVVERLGHNAVETGPVPVFDEAALLERVEGQRDLAQELARTFLKVAAGQMQQIREGLAAARPAAVQRPAHSLKGGAADLGGRQVVALAQRLEDAAGEGDLPLLQELAGSLEHAVTALTDALRQAFGPL